MSNYFAYRVKVPIFSGELFIVFTDDENKYPDGLDEDSLLACSMMHLENGKRPQYQLYFNMWHPYQRITPNEVAHEVSHTIDNILYRHGIERNYPDEPSAYLSGWVTEQVYKCAKKAKLTIN